MSEHVRILVTGSSGHLGEALMRVLPEHGHEVDRARRARVAVHQRRRVDRRPRRRARARWPAWRPSCTPRPSTSRTSSRTAAGVRRDQHHRHAAPARGGGGRGRRAGSCSPARPARSAARSRPRRARRPRGSPRTSSRCRATSTATTKVAAENLCELVAPRPRAADPDPAHLAVLPRARRPRRGPRRVRRPEPQGQRVALPPRRHRGRGERPPARARASARDRLRPLHHQRDHAVHARRPAPSSHATCRRSCAGSFPILRRFSSPRLADVPAPSSGCMSMSARGATSAGRRATTSVTRSIASPPAMTRAARWPARSARRATTRGLDRRLHRALSLDHRARDLARVGRRG